MRPIGGCEIIGVDLIVSGLNIDDQRFIQIDCLNLITQVLLINGSSPR